MSCRRLGFLVPVLALLALAVLAASASAAGEPNISLAVGAPKTALYGSKQKVTLTASNPAGQPRGYNLSFRAVLPKGVKFVAGSGSEVPRVIANAPASGETTLLFENVADLSPNSEYGVSYEVEAEASAYKVGGEYKDLGEAFISLKARNKPQFNAKGEAVKASVTGEAKAEAKTKLSAVELVKSEPSPEGELLRGLHDQQTVYTLTIKNNPLKPTRELALDDYLPAGLEFLACDEADHTTNAKGTNPGSKEEYAGSGPINAAANIPATEKCLTPTSVKTELVDPDKEEAENGPRPEDIYTHVRWEGLGELAPGAERKIQYIAAVPIRRNGLGWSGTEPPAAGSGQAANLDNNDGPETVDEEDLTNFAKVTGKFIGGPKEEEQPKVSDAKELTRTAEDLAVQKSVKPKTISEGQISTWTLAIETSEYRFVEDVRVDDVLPNGLCPLGSKNYEAPIQVQAECDPTGNEPSSEYTKVEEQENGSFKIHWDSSTDPALGLMAPSETAEIVFPTRTRVFYQQKFENAKPILTGDSWSNAVAIAGRDFARCAPNDPLCLKGQPKIFTQEAEGSDDTDASSASQQAGGITIDKTVRENDGSIVPSDCGGTYVQGTSAPLPKYRPGDKVCWTLRVDFASDLYAGNPVVTDFLPPGEKYIEKSAKPGPENNVFSVLNEEEASGGSLEWTIGENKSVESGSKIFEYRFATEMLRETTSAPGEITGNLMKFTYSNTEGKTFPLRDRAEVERVEPALTLLKGVYKVNGAPEKGNAANTNNVTVHGGDKVTFRVDLGNAKGKLAAEEVEIWDKLPAGIGCTAIESISDGGVCEGTEGPIVWKGLSVAAGASRAPLTYVAKIPENVAPQTSYLNRAGVTEYKTPTNVKAGGKFEYFPTENIDPARKPKANVPAVEDNATVTTAEALLSKAKETTVVQSGNDKPNQATIGEGVVYTLTATVPEGGTVFGSPRVTDPLGSRLKLVAGSVKGTVNGVAIPTGGFTVGEEGGNPFLQFPTTYSNAGSSGDDLVKLSFEAKVTDVAENTRVIVPKPGEELENKLENKGTFTYQTQTGSEVKKPASATVTLVEPLVAIGKAHAGGQVVKPGQLVVYTVTASNSGATNVSTANDSAVVDTVPAGMTPVNGAAPGTPVADGGTVEPSGGKWNEGARTITWQTAELAPGASKPLAYTLRVNQPADAGSRFENTATITTTSMPGAVEGERTAASPNHVGYEATKTDLATLTEATLEKSVAAPRERETIGDPLDYTVKLKLPPQIAFYDTTVEDLLPKGVAYDSTASIACAPGCAAVATGATVLNPKTEAGRQRLGWYFGAIASAEVERTITVVYRGHVTQEKEAGVKVKAGDELVNTAVGLYNGATKFKTPPTEPPPSSSFTNKTEEPTASVTVQEPKLKIVKSVAGASANPKTQPGDKLLYTLEIQNSGSSAAYDTVVEDSNPGNFLGLGPVTALEGAKYLTSKPGESLRWVVTDPIAAGGTLKLTYSTAPAPSQKLKNGQQIPNLAHVPSYFGAPEAQRKEEGPGRFREYTENPQSAANLEVALPQLTLSKTVGSEGKEEAEARIGVPFEWQLAAQNKSTAAGLKEVKLTDTLPQGWEYVKGSAELLPGGSHPVPTETPAGGGTTELVWANVGELAPLGTLTLKFKAIPTTALIGKAGPYTNTALASGRDLSGSPDSGDGPYSSTDTAKAILKTPPLKITKTPDAGKAGSEAVAGTKAAYTIVVENTGEAEATGVEVFDQLGAGNEYSPGTATASPEAGFEETGFAAGPGAGETTVKWTIASIPAKGKVTITVPVQLSRSLPDGAVLKDVATVKSTQQPTPESDEGGLDVVRQSNLKVVKIPSNAEPNAGEPETYSITVINQGPSDAANVVLKDKLPASLELEGPLPEGCLEVAGEIECKLAALAAEEAHLFKIDTRIRSGATGSVTNEATATSDSKDPEPGNNTGKSTVPLTASADLSIVKSGPSAPVLLGSTFTYTLEIANAGPSDAKEVVVTDPIPAEVEALKAETDAGSCVDPIARYLACELGDLVPGQKATIHLTVKAIGIPPAVPVSSVPVVNIAEVESVQTPDPEPENNQGEAKTEVLPAADLALTKTAPATVPANGEVAYSLHVENHGPSDATGVRVTDPLPAGTQLVTASSACALAGTTVTCDAGALKVGAAADFELRVRVPLALAGKPVTNTATVKGDQADPETTNDSSTVTTVAGPAADLSIAKTMGAARAGAPLTYTLAVTNHGPSTASAVTVRDTLPAGTSFSSASASQGSCAAAGGAVTCNLGPLASGASAQVSITVAVAAGTAGPLRNTATVEGPEPDPNPGDNSSTVEGPVSPARPSAPNLHVEKTSDDSSPRLGQPFHYTVTVTNRGDATARNVKVLDTMNGPVKVLSVDPEKGSCKQPDAGKVTCLLDRLAPGRTWRVVVTVEAEAEGGLRNVASAEAGNGEVKPADNRAVKDVRVKPAAAASFSLTKTAGKASVRGGKTVSFAIRLRTGAEPLRDLVVCDQLPRSLVFLSAPGAAFEEGRACWSRDFVAAGTTLKLRLLARAVRGYEPRRARNVATADAANAQEHRAEATVRIKPAFGGKPGGVTG